MTNDFDSASNSPHHPSSPNPIHTVFGPYYLWFGLRYCFKPGFKRFTLLPLIANFLLVTSTLVMLFYWAELNTLKELESLTARYLPSFLGVLFGTGLVTILLSIALLIIASLFFGPLYTFATGFICAPFYTALAEATLQQYPSDDYLHLPPHPSDWYNNSIGLLRLLLRESIKTWHIIKFLFLGVVVGLFISFMPLLNIISPIYWFGLFGYLAGRQYIDYAAEVEGKTYDMGSQTLKPNRWAVITFGCSVSFSLLIPFLNIIIPPAAVIGGTRLWSAITTQPRQNQDS